MPINSISLPPTFSSEPCFVFRAPNGRGVSIPSLCSFYPTCFVVFNLHAEIEPEGRNLVETMHANLWEGGLRNWMRQWDLGKQDPKLLLPAGGL
jgi:hypothetical protein